MIILKAENISKQYRLGLVGTGTISHDLNRWWAGIRGKEDPYLKVGAVNDRSTKADSDYVWALKDINFEVQQGEVLGIIGKNGAGKSTLLKILSRVTIPTTGEIKTKGRIASLLEVGTGFHPELTGRENIYLNGAILGMSKAEIKTKEQEIIEFSGCERYVDTPVKRYSSGMRVRLAFAVAAFLEPDILVIDEVLAVGDAEFQKKAIGKMQDISQGEGRTVLFVSHNMAAVKSLCTRAIVLEHGETVFEGGTNEAVDFYLNNAEGESVYKFEHNSGDGILKNIKIYSEEKTNTIFTLGAKMFIDIELRNPLSNFRMDIGIYNFNEEKISNLSTDYSKNINKEKLEFSCVIDKIMMATGSYYFKLAILDNNTLIEFHERIISFEVLSSDYYNTGIVVGKVPSYVFFDQTWK
ncbi:ABC transporter ATP-binding protein [Xanthomarina sp. F1114]|uniref:ABC transporter ATP-binding protein n=1 Tax=Xanthomarina sp. F1114 TaxID=2996019 RepID=UPI00225E3D81|nr:ABC transporter ATP-binding protein [Xanthomarina sp. F1114]MCX7549053.1 ABC transporter ATP-binding protein [Xanthomarina sp. F1114]